MPTSMQTEFLQRCNVCDSAMIDMVDRECNIAKCRVCGYVFDNPRPTLEELISFYSRPGKYNSWLSELEPRELLWKRRLDKLRSTKKMGSVLDVGAGIGQFLDQARNAYSEVYGTEVSSAAVAIAREKYKLQLFQGTLEELDAGGKCFDNITLFHVLEHVTDPKSVLKRCHSLLSGDGVLVIAVPNEIGSLRAFAKRVLGKIGLRKQGHSGKVGLPRIALDGSIDEIHLSHFTVPVLHRLLQESGFSVVASTLDPYYVATGLRRVKADLYYACCMLFLQLFKVNIYDAILVIARKVQPLRRVTE
jgi:2-polyprenyl-3-methyl-5-hydroxy-6-metoxy-1,4-benzoquinol methylase